MKGGINTYKMIPNMRGYGKTFLPIMRGTRQKIKIISTTLLPDRMTSFSPNTFILAHYQTYYTSLSVWLTFGQNVTPYPRPIKYLVYLKEIQLVCSTQCVPLKFTLKD